MRRKNISTPIRRSIGNHLDPLVRKPFPILTPIFQQQGYSSTRLTNISTHIRLTLYRGFLQNLFEIHGRLRNCGNGAKRYFTRNRILRLFDLSSFSLVCVSLSLSLSGLHVFGCLLGVRQAAFIFPQSPRVRAHSRLHGNLEFLPDNCHAESKSNF